MDFRVVVEKESVALVEAAAVGVVEEETEERVDVAASALIRMERGLGSQLPSLGVL